MTPSENRGALDPSDGTDHGTRTFEEALARISVPGGDPTVAREYVLGALARRTRRRRTIAGLCCTAVVALSLVVLGVGVSDPERDEVVTPVGQSTTTLPPRDSTTTSSSITTTSQDPTTTAAVGGEVPPADTSVGSTPFNPRGAMAHVGPPGPTPGADPPAHAEPSVEAEQSMTTRSPAEGELLVEGGEVGDLLPLRFRFVDRDGPGATPLLTVHTSEGPPPERGPGIAAGCDGGPGTTAHLDDVVQFTRAGVHEVVVTLTYCNAAPLVFTRSVTVTGATHDGAPGRAVLAVFADRELAATGADWSLRSDTGDVIVPKSTRPSVVHRIPTRNGADRFAVLVVLPAQASGVLTMDPHASGSPQLSGEVAPASGGDASPTLVAMSVP